MLHCNRCDYENENTSTYCVRCGTQLGEGLYEFVSSEPFTHYTREDTNHHADFAAFPPPYAKEPVQPGPPSKKILNIVLVTIIFCIGACIASFGLMGGLFSLVDTSLAFILGLGLFLASIIVFAIVIVQHNVFLLRWWLKILLVLAATGICFIAFIVASFIVFETNPVFTGIIYGGCIVCYGISIEVIALC